MTIPKEIKSASNWNNDYTYADRSIYQGQMNNEKKDGFGQLLSPNKDSLIDGFWVNDVPSYQFRKFFFDDSNQYHLSVAIIPEKFDELKQQFGLKHWTSLHRKVYSQYYWFPNS